MNATLPIKHAVATAVLCLFLCLLTVHHNMLKWKNINTIISCLLTQIVLTFSSSKKSSGRISVSRAYSGDSFMFRFPNASRKASFFLLCSDAQSVKWAEEVRENVKAEAKNEWRELPNDSNRHFKPFNSLKWFKLLNYFLCEVCVRAWRQHSRRRRR